MLTKTHQNVDILVKIEDNYRKLNDKFRYVKEAVTFL